VIELYAITDAPPPPLRDMPQLRAVPAGRLAAVCAPASDGQVSAEMLWRREAVVEALMESADLLPLRYGTRFDDTATAAAAVEQRQDGLAAALDRVRGAVELSVRVLVPAERDEDRAPASGTEYLRGKARAASAREAVAQSVHEPLAALARASVRRESGRPGERLTGAYLVDRDAAEAFAARVAALQASLPEVRLLCTGPWPPYSFAQR
jgi:hypothetical protein